MGIISNKLIYEKEKALIWLNRKSTKWMRQPTVIGMAQTITAIRERRASIARCGDGEFDMIFGRNQGFQQGGGELGRRLKEILKKNDMSAGLLWVAGSVHSQSAAPLAAAA